MVTSKEAIDILLKEYDTLRAELIARHTGGFQLLALVLVEIGACLGWIEKFGLHKSAWTLIAAFAVVDLVMYSFLNIAIGNCCQRVQEIEKHINELAGIDLLCWEGRFGAGKRGFRVKPGPDTTGNLVNTSKKWELPESRPDPAE
jgi:hypothetical protein